MLLYLPIPLENLRIGDCDHLELNYGHLTVDESMRVRKQVRPSSRSNEHQIASRVDSDS